MQVIPVLENLKSIKTKFHYAVDDSQRLKDKHQRKDNLICYSAAGEESHTFIEFLTVGHTSLGKFKNLIKMKFFTTLLDDKKYDVFEIFEISPSHFLTSHFLTSITSN
jgi:hypothetical protein